MSTIARRGTRTLAIAAGVIVALVALLFGVTAPALAAPPSPPKVEKYVALGDSYAAGQGAAAPLDSCLRSTAAYPVLLDAEPGTNLLRTAACSGATIADVAATQLSQVNRGTTLVTLTVGANDLNVGAVYAVCVPDFASQACQAAIVALQAFFDSEVLVERITDLVAAIGERAPNARIVVTGYPVPFVSAQSPATDVVNQATFRLSQQIGEGVALAAAAGANAEYGEVGGVFFNHRVGSADPWLGADPADPVSFLHPTATGQAAYLNVILAELAD